MGGCGIAVDEKTNLYFLTGNGVFNATNGGGVEFGDSMMKLSTTNGLQVADYSLRTTRMFGLSAAIRISARAASSWFRICRGRICTL